MRILHCRRCIHWFQAAGRPGDMQTFYSSYPGKDSKDVIRCSLADFPSMHDALGSVPGTTETQLPAHSHFLELGKWTSGIPA